MNALAPRRKLKRWATFVVGALIPPSWNNIPSTSADIQNRWTKKAFAPLAQGSLSKACWLSPCIYAPGLILGRRLGSDSYGDPPWLTSLVRRRGRQSWVSNGCHNSHTPSNRLEIVSSLSTVFSDTAKRHGLGGALSAKTRPILGARLDLMLSGWIRRQDKNPSANSGCLDPRNVDGRLNKTMKVVLPILAPRHRTTRVTRRTRACFGLRHFCRRQSHNHEYIAGVTMPT